MSPPASGLAAGAAWMVGARMVERLVGLVSTAFLARLLTPEDFGLVAMAMAVVAATELIGAFGFDWALVRQPGLTRDHLDTAWTLRILVALASCGLLAALAVPAAGYYGDPRIQSVVLFLAGALLISAVENPGAAMFRRDFRFDKEFILRTTAKVFGSAVAVTVAFFVRSYWALLVGMATGRLVSTGLSYALHPHRPRPTLAASRDLFSFSMWIFANNIVSFARTRVADFAIGRVVNARAVGLYATAFELAHLGHSEIAAPMNRAAFSGYAARADDAPRLREAYLTAVGGIWLIALPLAAGAVLTAPQLVTLLLGQGWTDAIPLLRLLGLGAVISLAFENASYVYWATGIPRLTLVLNVVGAAFFVPLLLLWLPQWQALGAAYAYIVSSLVVAVANVVLLRRQIGVSATQILAVSWRTISGCAVMAVVVAVLSPAGVPNSTASAAAQLMGLVTAGATTYFATVFGLWIIARRPAGAEASVLTRVRPIVRRIGRARPT